MSLSVAAVCACGGARAHRAAEATPAAKSAPAAPAAGMRPAREILLGEMCPAAVADRPAVKPLIVRRVVWSDAADEVGRAVSRGEARQFAVFAWDGRRVGVFSVAGASDVGLDVDVGVGGYAGASPCSRAVDAGAERADDPTCVAVMAGCGLAVAVLEPAGGFAARPFDEAAEPVEPSMGGGCVAGGKLLVDIDGDGAVEAFEARAFVEALRGPSEEVTAVDRGGASCVAGFAHRAIVPPCDPRDWRGLDLLGVIDLDGDGRRELVLAYNYADRRTWAVYSARATAARLELVGEAVPWSRPRSAAGR